MGSLVENDIVKLEWEKKNWLQKKGRDKDHPCFRVAGQYYESDNGFGRVPVLFVATTAFLFVDNGGDEKDDLWSIDEVISYLKKEDTSSFPYDCENYLPIIESGENECLVSVLEKYGITQFKEDIEARKKDIEPYGEEEIVEMG